jgi:hypothetical protein
MSGLDRSRARPGWAYDRDYVTSHALEQLPRVCGQLGTGEAVAVLERPRWWATLRLREDARSLHGLRTTGSVVALRLTENSYDLLFIDRAVGEWDCPNLSKRGDDLVSLAAWRLDLPDAKAAWRLARICGLQRPLP